MCVDYRGLDWFTIKNWYSRLLDQINHPKCTWKLTYMECTIWSTIEKVMNGKWHSEFVTTILNMLWCLLVLLMHMLFFNIWWMMFSVNIWMILWFVTSMTFSFSRRMWQTMNAMYVLFWKNSSADMEAFMETSLN